MDTVTTRTTTTMTTAATTPTTTTKTTTTTIQPEVNDQFDSFNVKTDSVDRSNFYAYKDGGFFYRLWDAKMQGVPEQGHQLGAVDLVVHLQLCTKGCAMDIPVVRNNKVQQMYVTEENGKAQISFFEENNGAGSTKINSITLAISIEALQAKLTAYIAHALEETVKELAQPPHCLAWAEVDHIDDENASISYHENLSANYDFVTASIGNSKDDMTNDTGTVVVRDDMCVATVVDGGANAVANRSIPLVKLPTYSAVLTTAAMHTVKHGVLILGLKDENLHAFFRLTAKLLLSACDIHVKRDQLPDWTGVVLYRQDGVPKKFVYTSAVVNKPGVTDIPDDGREIKAELLTATKNVKDRNVLRVSIDIDKFFIGKDDFALFSIPESSPRYLNVQSKYKSQYELQLNTAKSELVELKEQLRSSASGKDYGETSEKIEQKKLAIQKLEKEMDSPTVQEYERQRILNNRTAGVLIKHPIIEFAEEYEGDRHTPDVKFNHYLSEVKSLGNLKISLLEKQNAVQQFNQLKSSRKFKLEERLRLAEELEQSEKSELSQKLGQIETFEASEKLALSKKLWFSEELEQSEKFAFSKKLWLSEKWESSEIDTVVEKIKLSDKAELSEKLKKLEEPKLPRSELDIKLNQVKRLERDFKKQKKAVYELAMRRENVLSKLQKNLEQLKEELRTKQEEAAQLAKIESQKSDYELKQKQVQLLQNKISMQQKEVDAILRQQKIIDKKLSNQQGMDEALAQRESEHVKKELKIKVDQVKEKEQKEREIKAKEKAKIMAKDSNLDNFI